MKNLIWFLALMLLPTGCSTVVTYQSNLAAGPAKPAGYPISVYNQNTKIPRPVALIGTISIGGTAFTMFGGSPEEEMLTVMQTAQEKGADVVRVTSMEQPGFSNPANRITAELLRYSDTWETIAITEGQFQAYLEQNPQAVDPIEGVWCQNGQPQNRIGIIANRSKPGREFVAFVLGTACPSWRRGYKKMDITRGARPGAYNL